MKLFQYTHAQCMQMIRDMLSVWTEFISDTASVAGDRIRSEIADSNVSVLV